MNDKNITALKEVFHAEFEHLKINSAQKEDLLKMAFGKSAFYTFLPLEILSQCEDNDKHIKATMELSVYAFLYLSSLLYFDKLSDGQIAKDNSNNAAIYLYEIKEYAIRGFCGLFGNDSCFWEKFQNLKHEMFVSVDVKDYKNEDTLIKALGNKSILTHSYLIAMQIITGADLDWSGMEKALDSFHMGFQLFDDYDDFEEDYNNHQLNYYICQLRAYKNLKDEDFQYVNKFLYVSGIAQKGLQKSLQYLEEAYRLFLDLGLKIQSKITLAEINEIERKLFYIQQLLIKTEIKARQSKEFVHDNNISNAISSSLSFLLSNVKEDGSWEDFMTNGGIGNNWITGFVITMLGEYHSHLKEINDAFRVLYGKGGRYNESITQDADSINFLLMAGQTLKKEISKEDVAVWLRFQHSDGGFSTYIDDQIKDIMHYPKDADFSGWQSPHNCVTAVACWIAKALKQDDIYKKAYQYLESQIDSDGAIHSYWWSDDIYATAFAVLCGIRRNLVQYLLNRQNQAGAWDNFGVASPFYTALALKALIHVYHEEYDKSLLLPIQNGIKWLISQQCTDGSWKSENILRIPAPDVRLPQTVEKWYFTSFGVNIITDDFTRVFSTSLIHNVLCSYGKKV